MDSQQTYKLLVEELQRISSQDRAAISGRFFKTAEGQYGAGDIFRGIPMPTLRKIAKHHSNLEMSEINKLMNSQYHEDRMLALILMIQKSKNPNDDIAKYNFDFYIANIDDNNINNWDLVDVSAESLMGPYLSKNNKLRIELANSENLWKRRTAIVSTFYELKRGNPDQTYQIAEILLYDRHDLIQKATGWLLREMGKRVSEEKLIQFLDQYSSTMPRTTLRYCIERLNTTQKQHYMLQKNNKH